jgi:hypothetical protein
MKNSTMKKTILAIVLLVTSAHLLAQNLTSGSITTLDNSEIKGKVAIDYTKQIVHFKKDYNQKIYSFSKINTVTIGDDVLNKQRIGKQIYFTKELAGLASKATLYQIQKKGYLISKGDGTVQSVSLDSNKNRIPGTLAVLFNDCNSIRETLNRQTINSESKLVGIFNQYLACDSTNYAPTSTEIDQANNYTPDKASFYVGTGLGLNNVSFFENNDSESVISGQLAIGIIASPNFFGSIQGNLFFSLEGQAAFSSDTDFSNTADPVNFKTNTYRLLFGMEYYFNKTGKIQPLIGISAGITSDSFNGSYDGLDFDITGGNGIFVPKIGAKFTLGNQKHLGVILSYISEYSNDLRFPTEDRIILLDVDSQYLTLGVNYHF